MITVINIRANDQSCIYIGRKMPGRPASPLCNPYRLNAADRSDPVKRAECIEQYRQYLWRQMQSDTPARRELVRLIKLAMQEDLRLGCWCKPASCHGDVIKAAIEYYIRKCNTDLPGLTSDSKGQAQQDRVVVAGTGQS